MKVLFLDIDGVLNGDRYRPPDGKFGVWIDPTRLAIVKTIVEATDARIVLASSWRHHWAPDDGGCDESGREINATFAAVGLSVFDKTGDCGNDRAAEVTAWLAAHNDVTDFVAIDDFPYGEGSLKDHFVLTSRLRYGIDEEDARRAIAILGGEATA